MWGVWVWVGLVFGARSHHTQYTLQLIFVIGIHINFIRHTNKPQIKINEILNIKNIKNEKLYTSGASTHKY